MTGKQLKIVFMGTPEFAAYSLRGLVEGGYNVVGVVTMPDKPAGRGQKMTESDVKTYAQSVGLTVLQPEKLRDEEFLANLRALDADLGVVIAFRMLPEAVWSMPRLGTFNLHASLLPQYRGAAPINRAIMNGDAESGVTTFMLKHEIDTGDILAQRRVAIEADDNAGSLHDKLMVMGCDLVKDTIDSIADGTAKPFGQPESGELRPAPKIFKQDCLIDWGNRAKQIELLVRGLSPYPAAWTPLYDAQGEECGSAKIFKVAVRTGATTKPCGSICSDGKTYLDVVCGDGIVRIEEIQLAGKRRMNIRELLCGIRNIETYGFSKTRQL